MKHSFMKGRALVSILYLPRLIQSFTIVPGATSILSLHSTNNSNSYSNSASAAASATELQMTKSKIIDSHLHVWASKEESKTYAYEESQIPPDSLIDQACVQSLLDKMAQTNVDGALIVQPINHKYDHQYVTDAISTHKDKLKGMLLYDPTLVDDDEAVNYLEDLVLKGYVGVRFNPYLWPDQATAADNKCMSKGSGLAVYKRCAELQVPVGVMCFKGLDLHYDDIVDLIKASPDTTLILDHCGFTALSVDGGEKCTKQFEQLLSLSKYQNVIVKISALFRVAAGNDAYPFERVKNERFLPLLENFGKDRLMFGTDFPFILLEDGGYEGAVDLINSWTDGNDEVKAALLSGTAERLFGEW